LAEQVPRNSTIIRKDIRNGREDFILRFEAGGRVFFYLGLVGGGPRLCTSSTPLELNRWHHVAGTYDGSLMRLFIDAEPVGSLQTGGRVVNDPVSTMIGGGDGADEFLHGELDEVRIWRTARTQEDIARTMRARPMADHPDLLAYWSFDAIQGQIVPDESSTGLDGFLGDIETSDARDPRLVPSGAPISCIDAWTAQPSELPTAGGRVEIRGSVSLWPGTLSSSVDGMTAPILERTEGSLAIEAPPHGDGAATLLVESECGDATLPLTYRSRFVRGDVDGENAINIADAIGILNHLFADWSIDCADAADANDDGDLNIGDPIGLLMYLFAEGFAPPAPFPDPGPDPTNDNLRCGR